MFLLGDFIIKRKIWRNYGSPEILELNVWYFWEIFRKIVRNQTMTTFKLISEPPVYFGVIVGY